MKNVPINSKIAPTYLYKYIVCSLRTTTSIKNPIRICETTIIVNVLESPIPSIALTVK